MKKQVEKIRYGLNFLTQRLQRLLSFQTPFLMPLNFDQ